MTPWIDKDAFRRGDLDVEKPIDPHTHYWRCRHFGHKWEPDVARHSGAPFRFQAFRCSRCGAKT